MHGNIDLKHTLALYEKITSQGQKIGDEYKLGELSAGSDFDGYTIFITDQTVTLTVMFHNQYRLDYKRKIDLDAFLEKMSATSKKY